MKVLTMLLPLLLLHNGLTCWWGENDIIYCTNPDDIFTQGTKQWQTLKIYNNYKKLHLKENTFKRLIGLLTLELSDVDTLEEGSFNGLKVINELRIYKSGLEVISSEIFDNQPIKKLSIEGTKLKYVLPGVLDNLPQIELFSLHNNSIKQIQKKVFSNTGLQILILSNNGLERISSDAFKNMTQLKELSLHGNLLSSFNSNISLGLCDSLRKLWLSNNTLTVLTKDMFTTVPNLSELFLELNQIETIERGAFELVPNLEYLDLSNNKLRAINSNIFPFNPMEKLIYLGVHNNRLTFISLATIMNRNNLKYITYGGNPFQCICSKQLDTYVAERNITRICDTEYLDGKRPSCTFSSVQPKECLYDEDYSIELYEMYNEVIKQYPKLELKCDLRNGPSNATLNKL